MCWTDFGRAVKKAETDKGTQSFSKPLATFKTDTDTYKKTDEGKIGTLSSSKPWSTIKTGTNTQEKPKDTRNRTLPDAKTANETKEKTPGESPTQVKSLHFCRGNPPEAVQSKLSSETNANTNEKQMVQSSVFGDSIPAAGVKAHQNQSSTSSKGYLNKGVETKTVRTRERENSYSLEKLWGPRQGSDGDNRNILDDLDTPSTSQRSRRIS